MFQLETGTHEEGLHHLLFFLQLESILHWLDRLASINYSRLTFFLGRPLPLPVQQKIGKGRRW